MKYEYVNLDSINDIDICKNNMKLKDTVIFFGGAYKQSLS